MNNFRIKFNDKEDFTTDQFCIKFIDQQSGLGGLFWLLKMDIQQKTIIHWFRKGLRIHDNPGNLFKSNRAHDFRILMFRNLNRKFLRKFYDFFMEFSTDFFV